MFDKIKGLVDGLESVGVDLISRVAPWAAPLPTAYLIGRSTVQHLGWPPFIGGAAAFIVECLGLTTTATAFMFREYNKTKRQSDPKAPFSLTLCLVGIYFCTAITLTILLDTIPILAKYASAFFPVLGLCGMTILALRSDHRQRLKEITDDKAERSQRSKKAKANRLNVNVVNVEPKPELPKTIRLKRKRSGRQEAMNALLNYLRENPTATYREIAVAIGRSKGWISGAIVELEKVGAIRRDGNGDSIEVLPIAMTGAE